MQACKSFFYLKTLVSSRIQFWSHEIAYFCFVL